MKSLIPQPNPAATRTVSVLPSGVTYDLAQLRRPSPPWPPRAVFAGNRAFLRALRAAEMAMWQATGGDYFRSPSAN